MNTLQVFWKTTWRSVLVAVGYVIGLMLAGIIGAILGVQMGADTSGASNFAWMILAAFLLGVFLGPFAARLSLTRGQHFILWKPDPLQPWLGSHRRRIFRARPGTLANSHAFGSTGSGFRNCGSDNHLSIRKDRAIHFMDECTPYPPVVFMDMAFYSQRI